MIKRSLRLNIDHLGALVWAATLLSQNSEKAVKVAIYATPIQEFIQLHSQNRETSTKHFEDSYNISGFAFEVSLFTG